MLRPVGTLLILLPALALAQSSVEYAAGAAAASSAASGAKAAGKSIAGALEKLNRNLDDGTATSKTETRAAAPRAKAATRKSAAAAKRQPAASAAAPAAPVTPPPSYEDPAGIQEGMLYADVVRRFGPPALELTTAPGEQTLSYARNGASFDVRVSNGKVVAVQKTGAA